MAATKTEMQTAVSESQISGFSQDRLEQLRLLNRNFLKDRPVIAEHNADVRKVVPLLRSEIEEFIKTFLEPNGINDHRKEKLQELADITIFWLTIADVLDINLDGTLHAVFAQGAELPAIQDYIAVACEMITLTDNIALQAHIIEGDTYEGAEGALELLREDMHRIGWYLLALFRSLNAGISEESREKYARNMLKYPAHLFQSGDYNAQRKIASEQWSRHYGKRNDGTYGEIDGTYWFYNHLMSE